MKCHTNQEKAKVLSQSVLRVKDLKVLLDCGNNRATETAQHYREWFTEKYGFAPYDGQIDTSEFIIFAKIPEKRILKYAEMNY